jgi:hypothetical protein
MDVVSDDVVDVEATTDEEVSVTVLASLVVVNDVITVVKGLVFADVIVLVGVMAVVVILPQPATKELSDNITVTMTQTQCFILVPFLLVTHVSW